MLAAIARGAVAGMVVLLVVLHNLVDEVAFEILRHTRSDDPLLAQSRPPVKGQQN